MVMKLIVKFSEVNCRPESYFLGPEEVRMLPAFHLVLFHGETLACNYQVEFSSAGDLHQPNAQNRAGQQVNAIKMVEPSYFAE